MNHEISFPKKGPHRQRAHCNPLSDSYINYPSNADHVDWSCHFPAYFGDKSTKKSELFLNTYDYPIEYEKQPDDKNGRYRSIDMLDLGCGFGGMLYSLAPMYPDSLILGLEIREKVTTFVGKKIRALRDASNDGEYQNISVVRTNGMKFLANYIRKESLSKIFILFPDPHFKKTNWRRRIVTPQLLSTYGYLMKNNSRLYMITDVKDLYVWMCRACEIHPLFHRIEDPEDPAYKLMAVATDEGKKAVRNGETLYSAIYEFRRA